MTCSLDGSTGFTRRKSTQPGAVGGEGVTEPTADAWIAAWEAQATKDGLERGSELLGCGLGMDRGAARASRPP